MESVTSILASSVISTLFCDKPQKILFEEKPLPIIEQFVVNVEDFSSQYGSEISVSYTAFNLRGPPSNFPDYGDYPQSFVMRTYGTWWDEAPSFQKDFVTTHDCTVPSQDFVEVSFATPVYATEVAVFETYNPGALVRIWALSPTTTWILLWEGLPGYVGDTPRIFSPPITPTSFPVRTLRLEFNHKLLPYYTELDAVMLKGRELSAIERLEHYPVHTDKCVKPCLEFQKGTILHRVLYENLYENVSKPTKFITDKQSPSQINNITEPLLGDFQQLPDETIQFIMKYLDLRSLCRCAQVNTHFRRLACDAVLYKNIDLRPYWHCVRSEMLTPLSMHCKFLQKLDLSWCGSHHMVEPSYVIQFLKTCGKELTHLRMNCCKFVNDDVLATVVENCKRLQELSLRSVSSCTEWERLSRLRHLRRLDVYRTPVSTSAAVKIVRANPRLQHVNFGACKMISSMDEVAMALGQNCPGLVSADFWKSYSLTPTGIWALNNCKDLQELDLGWCLQAAGSGEWLSALSGARLRKLFLGALRGVSDRDLRRLLPAPRLAQLDLLGVRAVTADVCSEILTKCRELRLLDVSFCDQIPESEVNEWRQMYPYVSIKRSFQSQNLHNRPNEQFLEPIML